MLGSAAIGQSFKWWQPRDKRLFIQELLGSNSTPQHLFATDTEDYPDTRNFSSYKFRGKLSLAALAPHFKADTTSAHVPSSLQLSESLSKRWKECEVCFWKRLGASTYDYIKKSTIVSDGLLWLWSKPHAKGTSALPEPFFSQSVFNSACLIFCVDVSMPKEAEHRSWSCHSSLFVRISQ